MSLLNFSLISYKNRIIELPSSREAKDCIKNLTICFTNKTFLNEDRVLFRSSFFLETLARQKPKILLTQKPTRFGRLMKKKNEPVGVFVTLKKQKLIKFYNRLILEILPITTEVRLLENQITQKTNNMQLTITNLFCFKELQKFFFFTSGLKKLHFSFNFDEFPALTNYNKTKLILFELKLLGFFDK